MKQTSTQQNSSLGCFIQSSIGAALLLAVLALAFTVLAGAVSTPREIAVAVVPTEVPTLEVIEPTAVPTRPLPTAPTAAQVAQAAGVENASAGAYDPAAITAGQATFNSLCVACHGADARGLPNLGKNLVESEFVHNLTDQELLDFIKTGRPIWDPLNTTGVDMPPKGGNPALNDEQILDIIAYLRSLAA